MKKEKKLEQDAERWVDEHSEYLYRYAYFRLNNKQQAQDLVQDTFVSALRAYANFKGKSSERTWFVSILKRKLIDHYRKAAHKAQHETLPAEENPSNFDMNGRWLEERAPADWGNHPEKAIRQNEFMRVLKKCLSFLSARSAAVFTMKEIDDLSTDVICNELEISTSNVWVLLHRARTRLRRCLETEWFEALGAEK